jgi:large conductance mechanosensitive channel
MLQEFREFIMRGNVVDMAVGIIIGAAFTTIVQSLVNDIMMPPLGVILGNVDFKDYFIVLRGDGEYVTLAQAKEAGATTWNYGQFISACISFTIVAFALFMIIKAMNRLRRKQDAQPAEEPKPSRDVQLLEEIRDLMAQAVRQSS